MSLDSVRHFLSGVFTPGWHSLLGAVMSVCHFLLGALTPSVTVATCALLFTAASFWWLNVRQGKLVAYSRRSSPDSCE
jgi:hypothetical protein